MTKTEIAELYPDVLFADGFDEALMGISHRCGSDPVVAYDYARCVEVLMTRDGMTHHEALDFFEFNVLGSYVGPRTPVFIRRVTGNKS